MNQRDAYFSGDVETDGPIPGRFSMLSFGLVYAGSSGGGDFERPQSQLGLYRELKPVADDFEQEALDVSGLDRDRLKVEGFEPRRAMNEAAAWVREIAGDRKPVLVAFPAGFDWMWLHWYFTAFADGGSPFGHSQCFDVKTAASTILHRPVGACGLSKLPDRVLPAREHTHHPIDDAKRQAEIFANLMDISLGRGA